MPFLVERGAGQFLTGTDGKKGRENRGSLKLTGGTVTYGRNLMIENLANQTVEFFLRGTAAADGASILKLTDGAGATVWGVEAANNGSVRVCVGDAERTFSAKLADGSWHH